MKAILDQEAIKIAYMASKKPERPVLTSCKIGEGKIVACDGYILAERPIPTEPETGESILVGANDIIRAAKMWRVKNLTIESVDASQATISYSDDIYNYSMKTHLIQGQYPHYERNYPTTERKAYVALNAQLLNRMLKVAESGTIIIKLKIREPHEIVEFITNETKGLIMPMNVGEND